jgi:hypothetical protein
VFYLSHLLLHRLNVNRFGGSQAKLYGVSQLGVGLVGVALHKGGVLALLFDHVAPRLEA